ncbi:ParE toxin of type II toxin-antitoxin system, parDE [bacterium A37T11]|nr:ParE toxin of type II toxin-antitoxin system, parDE [bacterium A37T11]
MYSIKLLERAEKELFDACEWYEEKQQGLSARFLREINRYITIISKNPQIYQIKGYEDLRFAPLKVFPYVLIYWYDDNLGNVYITSVFHTKRKPFVR